MRSWAEQIDELVLNGLYADALALLDTIDAALLPDKVVLVLDICLLTWLTRFLGPTSDADTSIKCRSTIPCI